VRWVVVGIKTVESVLLLLLLDGCTRWADRRRRSSAAAVATGVGSARANLLLRDSQTPVVVGHDLQWR
jgi:hypothetical protein